MNFWQYRIWILNTEGFCSEVIWKNRWKLRFEEFENYPVSLLLSFLLTPLLSCLSRLPSPLPRTKLPLESQGAACGWSGSNLSSPGASLGPACPSGIPLGWQGSLHSANLLPKQRYFGLFVRRRSSSSLASMLVKTWLDNAVSNLVQLGGLWAGGRTRDLLTSETLYLVFLLCRGRRKMREDNERGKQSHLK